MNELRKIYGVVYALNRSMYNYKVRKSFVQSTKIRERWYNLLARKMTNENLYWIVYCNLILKLITFYSYTKYYVVQCSRKTSII